MEKERKGGNEKRKNAVYLRRGNKTRKSLTHQLRPLGKVELFYDGFISTDY